MMLLLEDQTENKYRGTRKMRAHCKQFADVTYLIIIILLHAQKEGEVKTQREAGHLPAKERVLNRSLPCGLEKELTLPTP